MERTLDFMELAAILQCLRNESIRNRHADLGVIMDKIMDMMRETDIAEGGEK